MGGGKQDHPLHQNRVVGCEGQLEVQEHAVIAQWRFFCECCIDDSSDVGHLCRVEIHLEEYLLRAHRHIFVLVFLNIHRIICKRTKITL